MNKIEKKSNDNYHLLIRQISSAVSDAKKNVASTINNALVETYWNIGKYIVEFEQDGQVRAKYGEQLLVNLSKDLTVLLGKGFSRSNLFNMRLFYMRFPIFQAVHGKLSWTLLAEIIRIDDELERNFYLAETVNENWRSRQLIQQKERGLFMQMNLYLGYFAIDKNNEGDNPPIGIILAKEKDEVMVQYAMYGNNNNLFVSKYQFYLPDLEELRNVLFKHIDLKGGTQ
jgi:hypothetical protein